MAEGYKSEKATPKKRRDERKKGNVFKSQDAIAVATLVGSFAVLWAFRGSFAERLGAFMTLCLETAGESTDIQHILTALANQGVAVLAQTVGPILAVTVLCAIAATFAQTRFLVSGESIKPKFNRISPLQGIKRLFSLRSVVEALKGLLKITILMVIIFLTIRDMFLEASKYLYTDVTVSSVHMADIATGMVMRIILAFIVLAGADFGYQWWDYERQLKMTKQEVKEEYKQTEGDPQVKGKIKQIQRQRAQQRMMQQVPGADVVIRNPTHVAVALRYKPDQDDAPVVVAKGLDELALRIVSVAEENGVAVIENVPLARSLYADAPLDQMIPMEFYGPVAEVLVYVLKLDNGEPPSEKR